MGESLITINVTKYDYCIPVLLCGFCNCGEKRKQIETLFKKEFFHEKEDFLKRTIKERVWDINLEK